MRATELLPEVADQTAATVRILAHAAPCLDKKGAKALERRNGFIAKNPAQLLVVVLRVGVDHRKAELLLAGKVVIERPFGDTSLSQHSLDSGAREALLGEDLHAFLDEFRTRRGPSCRPPPARLRAAVARSVARQRHPDMPARCVHLVNY